MHSSQRIDRAHHTIERAFSALHLQHTWMCLALAQVIFIFISNMQSPISHLPCPVPLPIPISVPIFTFIFIFEHSCAVSLTPTSASILSCTPIFVSCLLLHPSTALRSLYPFLRHFVLFFLPRWAYGNDTSGSRHTLTALCSNPGGHLTCTCQQLPPLFGGRNKSALRGA